MKSLKDTPLAKADKETIEQQLKLLIDDFLIEKTDEGITTHPVIRDYFRAGHKIAGSRREVADFLKARPGAEIPKNIEEVHDLVEAVQLLCDDGEFKVAHDLRKARLAEWGYGFDVFRDLPAISEGLEYCLAFVGDETRQQKVARALGKDALVACSAGVSLYNYYLGNLTKAIEWQYKVIELDKQQSKQIDPVDLDVISLIEMAMGDIKKARELVSQALSLSYEIRNLDHFRSELTYKAYYEFLLGNSIKAYEDFENGYLYFQQKYTDQQYLVALSGNYQTEFFIRIRAWKQFAAANTWDIQECKKYNWNHQLAICHLLQGWYEICQRQLSLAGKALEKAEHILRPSGMLEYICRLDWVWALLAEAKEDYKEGLQRVNDSLMTCADKGFRLRQADHFVLRGRLYLMQFHKENQKDLDLIEKAGDDGNEALKIADDTGYIWAKVDALELLCSYQQTRAKLSGFNTEDEKESARHYEKEAKAIKKGLFLTEKQMQEAKAKAREEFEKQTAGWDEELTD